MKKYFLSFIIAYIILNNFALAQNSNYPFEVKVSGKGNSAIVFIPGFASSGDVWNETKTLFENNYTCYTLTMAGFAGVPAETEPSFIKWENSIAAFIKNKKLKNTVIIGHSMGGVLALAIASDYPEFISKIVVVDALPCLTALRDSGFKPKQPPDCDAIIAYMTKLTDSQFYAMQKNATVMMVADTTKREEVVDWSMKTNRKTFAFMYCDFSNTDLRTKISSIRCPALILLEPYFNNINSSIMEQYKNCKTAELRYANKGLHFIMFDDKEWYNKQLLNFIK